MSTPVPLSSAPVSHKTNILAIVGFSIALAPIILIFIPYLSCLAFLCPLAAIILGIIALTQINKPGNVEGGKGFAIAAIAIGGFLIILLPVLVIAGLSILGPSITNVFNTISQTLSAPTP
jgi:Flp pilus assembly pilin Flp